MIEVTGDLWSYQKTHWIVIPTNIGYTAKGDAVMGAGVAKDAKKKCPSVVAWYGEFCKRHGADTPVVDYISQPDNCRLILFPTKPFNAAWPHLSWQAKSTLELVRRSAEQLATSSKESSVALPLVGCGLGGLPEEEVVKMLRDVLREDRFTLIYQPPF